MSLRHLFRRPPSVDVAEAMLLLERGALVVDVRGAAEHRRNRVPGSVLLPLGELARSAERLPDDRTLIAFCTGGLLSAGAANLLVELGFDAVDLRGGLIAWRSAGGPLEHG